MNADHVAIVRKGSAALAQSRTEHPNERLDLRGADLSRADLSGAVLSRADLSDAVLSRAVLCNANLDGAKITYRGSTVVVRFDLEKKKVSEK